MISEEQQDAAALYALGLLDAVEAAQLEAQLSSDAEFRALVDELRETASSIALASSLSPPDSVKRQVLHEIAAMEARKNQPPEAGGSKHLPLWIPWAIAAVLTILCGVLASDRARLHHEIAQMRMTDPLMQARFIALAPTGFGPAKAKATIAWEPGGRTGVIRISNLPVPDRGKDYQLWAVDATHKNPISAGVVRVDANGNAQVRFQLVEVAPAVKAFAISVEREGGVPNKEGPIVLVGN